VFGHYQDVRFGLGVVNGCQAAGCLTISCFVLAAYTFVFRHSAWTSVLVRSRVRAYQTCFTPFVTVYIQVQACCCPNYCIALCILFTNQRRTSATAIPKLLPIMVLRLLHIKAPSTMVQRSVLNFYWNCSLGKLLTLHHAKTLHATV